MRPLKNLIMQKAYGAQGKEWYLLFTRIDK